jgi:hypothetical protein
LAAAIDESVVWDSQTIRNDGRHVIKSEIDINAANDAGFAAATPQSVQLNQQFRASDSTNVSATPETAAFSKLDGQSTSPTSISPNSDFRNSGLKAAELQHQPLANVKTKSTQNSGGDSFQTAPNVTHVANEFVPMQAGTELAQPDQQTLREVAVNDSASETFGQPSGGSAAVIRNNEFHSENTEMAGRQSVQSELASPPLEANQMVPNPYLASAPKSNAPPRSNSPLQTGSTSVQNEYVAQASTTDEHHHPLQTESSISGDNSERYPLNIVEDDSNDFVIDFGQSESIETQSTDSNQQRSNDETKPGSSDDSFQLPSTPVQRVASMTASAKTNNSTLNPNSKDPNSTTPQQGADSKTPHALLGASNFVMAEQPKVGDHWKDDRPITDQRAVLTETYKGDFSPDALSENLPYDPYHQMDIYEGKTLNANQRPIVELGRPWYQLGQLSEGYSFFGKHNNITPQFLIYGDIRSAYATNTQNGNNVTQSALEVNLDFDLKLTGTERFHMFMAPLDNGAVNTGYLFDDDEWVEKFDANIDFGYFEGDLGAMMGGLMGETLPFDFPFAIGVMPLLLQNGVWMEDAFLGVAATIPAKNSAKFDISNMDVTFFAGFDKITSAAFQGDDSAGRMWGMASFIEALNGYIEVDYAFLEDRTFDDRSYHNVGIGYTRRYGRLVSNSTRVIANMGQSTDVVDNRGAFDTRALLQHVRWI